MEYFNTRRTIRKYTDKHIDDALLNEMLEAATHAPTTGNMQLYSVIATRSAEGKAALAPAHFNQPSVTSCDVVLTFCADFNRFTHWCEINAAQPGYSNFQSFVAALLDTALLAQQFCTIAEMNGLGCCYLGTTTYNAQQIADALQLPPLVVPVTTITLGYPAEDAPVSDRLPLNGILHTESYHEYSDEEIRNIYAYKESLSESRRFIEENGKQTLAQVFTDIRYTRQANEHFSRLYLDFIVKQGFTLPE